MRLPGEGDERIQPLTQQCRGRAELRFVLDGHAEQSADHGDGQRQARSAMTSNSPASATLSSSPSTIAAMSGSSALTTFGENALLTSLRCRVWSGGSRNKKPGVPNGRGCSPAAMALGDGRLEPVGARRRMTQHLVAVGEAGQHVQVVLRHLQRATFEQLPVDRIRVGTLSGLEQCCE